jgi:GxxExxY protein
MDSLLSDLPKVIQNTYFQLNPMNPNNTEDNFQELLRHNLTLMGYHVESEITCQKHSKDIMGNTLRLKNKTERYDLMIESLKTIFELKYTTDQDENSVHQLWNYMNHNDFEYGILINFTKPNKKQCYKAMTSVYHKQQTLTFTDTYNVSYSQYKYILVHSYESEDYKQLVDGGSLT